MIMTLVVLSLVVQDAVPPADAGRAANAAGTRPATAAKQVEVAPPVGDGDGAENRPMDGETTPAWRASVDRGLRALAGLQNDDGSFGRGRFGRHSGITSLCALALMADGHLPGRGEYGDQVAKALEFVLSNVTESGLLAAETTAGPMYGHGFSTLFLGEIYGMNQQDTRVRDTLVRAVQLIIASQNAEGGWRYNPVPNDADVSVTICQVMALRSARNAGIKVPRETIDAAINYILRCQNDDGGFRYMTALGQSAWPRSAAGVASLFYAGVYEGDSITRGLSYIARNDGTTAGGPMGTPHFHYGAYYTAQTMYLAGGTWWRSWWPQARDGFLATQERDGLWVDHQNGPAYATAMSLIVLQMPNRYLPIFQR